MSVNVTPNKANAAIVLIGLAAFVVSLFWENYHTIQPIVKGGFCFLVGLFFAAWFYQQPVDKKWWLPCLLPTLSMTFLTANLFHDIISTAIEVKYPGAKDHVTAALIMKVWDMYSASLVILHMAFSMLFFVIFVGEHYIKHKSIFRR